VKTQTPEHLRVCAPCCPRRAKLGGQNIAIEFNQMPIKSQSIASETMLQYRQQPDAK
jgi:hypothetical protein